MATTATAATINRSSNDSNPTSSCASSSPSYKWGPIPSSADIVRYDDEKRFGGQKIGEMDFASLYPPRKLSVHWEQESFDRGGGVVPAVYRYHDIINMELRDNKPSLRWI